MIAGSLDQLGVFGPGHRPVTLAGTGQFFAPEAGRYHVVARPSTARPVLAIGREGGG